MFSVFPHSEDTARRLKAHVAEDRDWELNSKSLSL
jgi:hypothetical protein